MQQIKLRLKNRKGAMLVLAAVTVVTLTITLAVAVDMGRLYLQRNELQTGADAGALAGAIQIAVDSTSVPDSAVSFAGRNKVLNATVALASANVTCGVWDPTSGTFSTTTASLRCGDGANAVQVIRTDSSHYLFPQFLSASRLQIVTKAVAWVAPAVTRSNCIKPLAVPDTVLFDRLNPFRTAKPRSGNTLDSIDFQILRDHSTSLSFCLKDGSNANSSCPGGQQPGNFNPIQLPPGDNGGSVYGNNLGTCNPADVGIGDTLSVETGNIVGQTKQGISTWCSQYPANQCPVMLVLWHNAAPSGATASGGKSCQGQTVGAAWCVVVSMLGGAILTPNSGGGNGNGKGGGGSGTSQGVISGYFSLLNDPGGGIGTTPGLLHRVILVQ